VRNQAAICPVMVRIDFSEVAKAARTPKAMITTPLVTNRSSENFFWLFFGTGFQCFFTSQGCLDRQDVKK